MCECVRVSVCVSACVFVYQREVFFSSEGESNEELMRHGGVSCALPVYLVCLKPSYHYSSS